MRHVIYTFNHKYLDGTLCKDDADVEKAVDFFRQRHAMLREGHTCYDPRFRLEVVEVDDPAPVPASDPRVDATLEAIAGMIPVSELEDARVKLEKIFADFDAKALAAEKGS